MATLLYLVIDSMVRVDSQIALIELMMAPMLLIVTLVRGLRPTESANSCDVLVAIPSFGPVRLFCPGATAYSAESAW